MMKRLEPPRPRIISKTLALALAMLLLLPMLALRGFAEGEEAPGEAPAPGSISGFLWIDGNGMKPADWNGLFNAGEQALPGYTVTLYAAGDFATPIGSAVTGAGGAYLFGDLQPGDYAVGVASGTAGGVEYLAPMAATGDNAFAVNWALSDSEPPYTARAFTAPITITDGEAIGNINAGMRLPMGFTPLSGSYTVKNDNTSEVIGTCATLSDAVDACVTTAPCTITATADDPAIGAAVAIPADKHITLTSTAGQRYTLTQTTANDRHLAIRSGGSLTLENIILDGNNPAPGASSGGGGIENHGTGSLTMNAGATIQNCYNSGGGAGVYSNSGNAGTTAVFTMNPGSEIIGNTSGGYGAAGVYCGYTATTINGGTISGNEANGSYSCGGGVYVDTGSTLAMHGGTISGNTSSTGGGVYLYNSDSALLMDGGTISGNTATGTGGGGIYSNSYSYTDPVTDALAAYPNIRIAGSAVVSGNTAATGTFAPPGNAADFNNPALRPTHAGTGLSMTFDGSLLNNDNINYLHPVPPIDLSETTAGKGTEYTVGGTPQTPYSAQYGGSPGGATGGSGQTLTFGAGADGKTYELTQSGVRASPPSPARPKEDTSIFNSIVVPTGVTVTLVAEGIDLPGRITLQGNANVTLLLGAASFTQGVTAPAGTTLTIDSAAAPGSSSGSFTATGTLDSFYAAIGGGNSTEIISDSGAITINGGTVTAQTTGSSYAAAIGGGWKGRGDVTINGGTVTAASAWNGAGIGSGWNYNHTNAAGPNAITITGGTVTATAPVTVTNGNTAGIGGAGNTTTTGACGNVLISGGTVRAQGVCGIGGSGNGGGTITITGGAINATASGTGSAGIGSSSSAVGNDIVITGGTVTARGATGGAGIGRGNSCPRGGTVTIGKNASIQAYTTYSTGTTIGKPAIDAGQNNAGDGCYVNALLSNLTSWGANVPSRTLRVYADISKAGGELAVLTVPAPASVLFGFQLPGHDARQDYYIEVYNGVVLAGILLRSADDSADIYSMHTLTDYNAHVSSLVAAGSGILPVKLIPRYIAAYRPNGGTGAAYYQDTGAGVGSSGSYTIRTLAQTGLTPPEGMSFAGWNTSASGGGQAFTPGQNVGTAGNLILYAQWVERPLDLSETTAGKGTEYTVGGMAQTPYSTQFGGAPGGPTSGSGQTLTFGAGANGKTYEIIQSGVRDPLTAPARPKESTSIFDSIVISTGVTVTLKLKGIDLPGRITLQGTANATLLLDSDSFTQGVTVPAGTTLAIDSAVAPGSTSGSLTATAPDDNSAAIGGLNTQSGGALTIHGGTVTAQTTGASCGAAIGGGADAPGGTITITGGAVKATAVGIAIGGGYGNSGTNGYAPASLYIDAAARVEATSIYGSYHQPAIEANTNLGTGYYVNAVITTNEARWPDDGNRTLRVYADRTKAGGVLATLDVGYYCASFAFQIPGHDSQRDYYIEVYNGGTLDGILLRDADDELDIYSMVAFNDYDSHAAPFSSAGKGFLPVRMATANPGTPSAANITKTAADFQSTGQNLVISSYIDGGFLFSTSPAVNGSGRLSSGAAVQWSGGFSSGTITEPSSALAPNTKYYLQTWLSTDLFGMRYSGAVSFTTLPSITSGSAALGADTTQALLSAAFAGGQEALSVKIYYDTGPVNPSTSPCVTLTGGDYDHTGFTDYELTGLTPGSTYNIRIVLTNAQGPDTRELTYTASPLINVSVPVKLVFAAFEGDRGAVTAPGYYIENNGEADVVVTLKSFAVEDPGGVTLTASPAAQDDLGLKFAWSGPPSAAFATNGSGWLVPSAANVALGQLGDRDAPDGANRVDFTLEGTYIGGFGVPKRPAYSLVLEFELAGP